MGKCPRCGKAVYFAERAQGPGGEWHKMCLKCKTCRKLLDSTTLCNHDGEVYCKACYGKHFGPHGFGYAGGGSIMHTQGVAPPQDAAPAPVAAEAPAPAAEAPASVVQCAKCGTSYDKKPKFCSECGTPF